MLSDERVEFEHGGGAGFHREATPRGEGGVGGGDGGLDVCGGGEGDVGDGGGGGWVEHRDVLVGGWRDVFARDVVVDCADGFGCFSHCLIAC